MYNRKFDIRRDFSLLNELENKITPIAKKIPNEEEREILIDYLRKTFNNQFKKQK